MLRSLRWQLLIWNALILLLVEIGFGAALYFKIRQAGYDEIDAELIAAARTIDGALRALARPILTGEVEPPPPGPPPEFDFLDPDDPDRPPPPRRPGGDRRPNDDRRPPVPPRQNVRQLLSLPKPFLDRLGAGPSAPFMIAWAANGNVIQSFGLPDDVSKTLGEPLPPKADFRVAQVGPYRQVLIRGPQGTHVLVGRSTIDELAKLDALRWQILMIGTIIFIVGLAGSWWLARRIVRPIAAMSATAASISANNLSSRIDVDDIDRELTTLGQVLNGMLERLESSFEQQTNFSANASHELRTPLTVIMTNAELALSRSRTPEEYREALEVCLRASQRMKLLVDDLLVLARADAGKLELTLKPLDLTQLSQETIALLTPIARERQIEISLVGKPVLVSGDADRLGQLLTNLISNAITYNRPQGKLHIKVATVADRAVLTIQDTGIGIPPADLPHVFDRFYRVDKARSRNNGGSGLGLAICKMIVDAHGGEVHIASTVGQGTIVEVRLPAAHSSPTRQRGRQPS
jgi:two-component system, OmpR family, sensor kinase